jgi:hypothetical protein
VIGRSAYRLLVALHPSYFRDQHGDEMLCIFDECAPEETQRLIADALRSTVRQWLFHSGWWKLVAGAAVSSLLVLACGYSTSQSFNWSLIWGAQQRADLRPLYGPPDPSFNELEFETEARQAIRMLAQYSHEEDAARRSDRAVRSVNNSSRAPNADNRDWP